MVECAKSVRAANTEQSDVEVVYGRICKEVEAKMASFQDAPSDLCLELNKMLVGPTRPIQISLLFLVWLEIFLNKWDTFGDLPPKTKMLLSTKIQISAKTNDASVFNFIHATLIFELKCLSSKTSEHNMHHASRSS